MKILTLLILMASSITMAAQEFPNNFRIDEYLEVFNNDSILIFYNKNGSICRRECADLFRIAKLDKLYCNVNDTVRDYYIDGTLQFESLMKNNALNGPAVYYYSDGVIKQMGTYENDLRKGFWKYYYPDSRLEKEFFFVNGIPSVVTLLSPDGDTLVNNGNGDYTGVLVMDATENGLIISGQIKDYLMDGEWTLKVPAGLVYTQYEDGTRSSNKSAVVATEQFKEGKMVKGNDGFRAYKDQKIKLHGYVLNEYLNIYENTTLCFGSGPGKLPRNSEDIIIMGDTFYPGLLKELKKLIHQETLEQWLLIGIHIGIANDLQKLIVYSSVDDTFLENNVHNLIMNKFFSWNSKVIEGKPVESDLIFTVLVRGNNVLIPANGSWKK